MNRDRGKQIFINHYLALLGKYTEDHFSRDIEKVLTQLDCEIFLNIFDVYYKILEELNISRNGDLHFESCNRQVKQSQDLIENFFLKLIVVMKMTRLKNQQLFEERDLFLVKIPKEVFWNSTHDRVTAASKKVQAAMNVFQNTYEEISNFFESADKADDHIDYLLIKKIYENLFYRYYYGIIQGKRNTL